MLIPDNVLKRLLGNVYFILGDGVDAADGLGRRYGMYVYHTCEHRERHALNADPEFQPGLCRFAEYCADFFALDPAEAFRCERETVRDFTPMVIMDLVQLAAKHERVICENDIDLGAIINCVTHAVMISSHKGWGGFIRGFEDAIGSRGISENEKERLVGELHETWGDGKPENPRGTVRYGIRQIIRDDGMSAEQTADAVAEHFGLSNPNAE